jgi:hypothetical protein
MYGPGPASAGERSPEGRVRVPEHHRRDASRRLQLRSADLRPCPPNGQHRGVSVARPPPHVREPPRDGRRRPSNGPRAARPQDAGDDAPVCPPLARPPARRRSASESRSNCHHYCHRRGTREGRRERRRASGHAADGNKWRRPGSNRGPRDYESVRPRFGGARLVAGGDAETLVGQGFP